MDRRVGTYVARGITAAAMLAASEMLISRSADASSQTNPNNQPTQNLKVQDYFGALSGNVKTLPPRIWECLTELGVKWHDRKGDGTGNLADAEVTVFNTSNPDRKVTLKPESSIPYDANGYAGYKRNTKNPRTGEDFALLEGDRVCEAECKTEISLFESKDGQPIGPTTKQLVDCPNPTPTRCETNLWWRDEGRRFQIVFPTATATLIEPTKEPTSTPKPTPDSSFVQGPK